MDNFHKQKLESLKEQARINDCRDDVMAVAFDTYFVSESMTEAIGVRN